MSRLLESRHRANGFAKFAGAICLALTLAGCAKPGASGSNVSQPNIAYEWHISPTPPRAGIAQCTLSLRDDQKQPLSGAKVHLEGDMSHPGMQPSEADMKESSPGHYSAPLNFTMGGDWFILIDATLSDGRTWHQQVSVAGVKSR